MMEILVGLGFIGLIAFIRLLQINNKYFKGEIMKILLSVLITLISLLVLLLIFVYSGWYNVSAMNDESGLMKWVFNSTKSNSIESRLKEISVPDLNDLAMLKEGFEHYNEMCVSCHGAPGIEESELSKGLNPPTPYLVEVAKGLDPKELFWITKNGIRMTGMPAWGKTHSDEKIWAIVAFMKTLPELTPEEYKKMGDGSEDMAENENHIHSDNNGEHHH
jgi:mono/diheme cytochrome c family protein